MKWPVGVSLWKLPDHGSATKIRKTKALLACQLKRSSYNCALFEQRQPLERMVCAMLVVIIALGTRYRIESQARLLGLKKFAAAQLLAPD